MRDGNPTKYEGYPSMVEVASNPEKYQPFYGVNPSLSTGAKMENIAEEL
jgi:hypothetical protein